MADATRGFPAFDPAQQSESRSSRGESVGAELRRRREQRNITVFQACNDLRLKEGVVRAIESGQHSSLPDIPFAIGYVRTYARYLGLDPREACDRFKTEIADLAKARSSAVLIAPSPIRQGRVSGGAMLAISIVLGAAIYGGWYVHVTGSGDPANRAEATRPAKDSVLARAPSIELRPIEPWEPPVMVPLPKVAEPPPVRVGSTTAAEAPHRLPAESDVSNEPRGSPAAKAEIILRASGQVWIQLKDRVSAAIVYQGMMSPGMEYHLPDDRRFLIDIGNPGALTLVVGGRALKPLGAGNKPLMGVSLDPKDLAKLP